LFHVQFGVAIQVLDGPARNVTRALNQSSKHSR
jgi:hypothetical protein